MQYPCYTFFLGWVDLRAVVRSEEFKSMKIPNLLFRNWTLDLPAYSAVLQLTAPPPIRWYYTKNANILLVPVRVQLLVPCWWCSVEVCLWVRRTRVNLLWRTTDVFVFRNFCAISGVIFFLRAYRRWKWFSALLMSETPIFNKFNCKFTIFWL
jgi:hypothetical protein